MRMGDEDTEGGIQLMYQQPLTEGIKKYGKRLINAERIHEYAAYAFRKLRAGIPRPVHLDFPTEVASHKFESAKDVEYFYDKTKYRTETKPHPDPKAVAAAVQLIKTAHRPLIVSSTGVFYRGLGRIEEVRGEGPNSSHGNGPKCAGNLPTITR